jgi:hypothetical protein
MKREMQIAADTCYELCNYNQARFLEMMEAQGYKPDDPELEWLLKNWEFDDAGPHKKETPT